MVTGAADSCRSAHSQPESELLKVLTHPSGTTTRIKPAACASAKARSIQVLEGSEVAVTETMRRRRLTLAITVFTPCSRNRSTNASLPSGQWPSAEPTMVNTRISPRFWNEASNSGRIRPPRRGLRWSHWKQFANQARATIITVRLALQTRGSSTPASTLIVPSAATNIKFLRSACLPPTFRRHHVHTAPFVWRSLSIIAALPTPGIFTRPKYGLVTKRRGSLPPTPNS